MCGKSSPSSATRSALSGGNGWSVPIWPAYRRVYLRMFDVIPIKRALPDGLEILSCRSLPTGEAVIAIETELKLVARSGDLPVLRRALGKLAAGRKPLRANLISTYYETEDRALRRKGLTLRVREGDGRFVQTVKAIGSENAGTLSRGEWEDVIAGGDPDLHGPETSRFLEPDIVERLKPVFRTEVRRDVVELSPAPGTRIEAAIDRGEIIAPDQKRSLAISEVELELKSGDVGALYDIAQELMATAPLRIDPRSKAERGYELASGRRKKSATARSQPPHLDPELSAAEAFERIGRYCLNQILRNEAAALSGDPDGVHQMRVGIRRLRAAISAFRKLLPDDERRWASEELRWLANTLGEARNLDVFKSAVVNPARGAIPDKRDLRILTEAVRSRRQMAYSAVEGAIRSTRYSMLILRLLRWFDGRSWPEGAIAGELQRPIREVAPAMLDRRRRSVERRSRSFADQLPSERHELRIALKKMRYTAELFASLYPARPVAEFTQQLKHLQDALGSANDVHVGETLVPELAKDAGKSSGIMTSGQHVLDWHKRRLMKEEKKIREDVHELKQAKPFWLG
jgi:inorganic triphosphatase YgiF